MPDPVDDDEPGSRVGQGPARFEHDGGALPGRAPGEILPPAGLPRHQQGQGGRDGACHALMNVENEGLLVGVGRGRDPDGSRPDRPGPGGQFDGIGRRRRNVELEVARHRHPRRTEATEPRRVPFRLREHERQPAKQRADEAGRALPAPVGPSRQPRVDENRLHAAPRHRDERVGPKLRFRQDDDVGLPVVEEALDGAGQVERRELVRGARRQPRRHDAGGGRRSRGEEHVEAARRNGVDQRQQRHQFADARPVAPGEGSRRPGPAGMTRPLREARPVLLAAPLPPAQKPGRRRLDRGGRDLVGAQGQRIAHAVSAVAIPKPRRPGSTEPTIA